MRSRNLKPGTFKNELLGSSDPLHTILFEGLWCLADREGRLEDRPLRICAELFPYRRQVNERKVDTMLQWLHEKGFIVRYGAECEEATGSDQTRNMTKRVTPRTRYIQVAEFLKHQNPHKHEAPSKIPALTSSEHPTRTVLSTGQAPDKHSATTVEAQDKHPTSPASSLIPSSLIPLSESKNPLPPHGGGDLSEGGRRANGNNPRANGTNPRAVARQERDDAEWEALRQRAQACGFRDPWPADTLSSYETSLRLHERAPS